MQPNFLLLFISFFIIINSSNQSKSSNKLLLAAENKILIASLGRNIEPKKEEQKHQHPKTRPRDEKITSPSYHFVLGDRTLHDIEGLERDFYLSS